jgi:hypothetical protein
MQSACAVLYCHVWPVRLYRIFPHYLINGTIFGKKLLNIKCLYWFSLQLSSEIFVILRRNEGDISVYVHKSSCKVTVILAWFELIKLEFFFFHWVSKKIDTSNFMKIRPVGAALFHADGVTDMVKLVVGFRDFANAPSSWIWQVLLLIHY